MAIKELSTEKAMEYARDLLQGLAKVEIATCTGTESDNEKIGLDCMIRAGPEGKELGTLRIKAKENELTEMEVFVRGKTIISEYPE